MDKVKFHALGSIVLLDGGIQKIVITSRGLIVNNNGEEMFFDYAGVPYPEGVINDRLLYFNHDGIAKVIFEGYSDGDDEIFVDNINRYLEAHPDTKRG